MNLSDLCKAVETYLTSITIGNKSGTYTPVDHLVNGAVLKTFSTSITYCPVAQIANNTRTETVTQTVKTNESIPSNYLAKADNARITTDWNNFKKTYISKMLNANETMSISSVIMFIYLVRCFIDGRFKLFTDVYHGTCVWLYDTNTTVDYKVDSNLKVTDFSAISETDNLNSIIAALANQVSNRNSYYVLKSTFTITRA